MSASTEAKEAGLKSLQQMIDMTGVARSTLEDWHKTRPILFGIIIFGCQNRKVKG